MPKPKLKTHTPAEEFKKKRIQLGYLRDKKGKLISVQTKKYQNTINQLENDRKLWLSQPENTIGDKKEWITLYNEELQNVEKAHTENIKKIDVKRLKELKQRQLKDWIGQFDKIISKSKNTNTKLIISELITKLYNNLLPKLKPNTNKHTLKTDLENKFYNELHKLIVPTDLKNMSSKDIIELLNKTYYNVVKKIKHEK